MEKIGDTINTPYGKGVIQDIRGNHANVRLVNQNDLTVEIVLKVEAQNQKNAVYIDTCYKILSTFNRPMSASEIWEAATKNGYLNKTKHSEGSMTSQLNNHNKNADAVVIRRLDGTYSLPGAEDNERYVHGKDPSNTKTDTPAGQRGIQTLKRIRKIINSGNKIAVTEAEISILLLWSFYMELWPEALDLNDLLPPVSNETKTLRESIAQAVKICEQKIQ